MTHHLLDIAERCTPKRYFLTLCLILLVRGAKVGGVGGSQPPPEFWKGGLNPS